MDYYPHLKAGVTLHELTSEIISLSHPASDDAQELILPAQVAGVDIRALLRACDGRRKINELSEHVGLEREVVSGLIENLRLHRLVNLVTTPLPYQQRYNSKSGKIESVPDLEALHLDPAMSSYLHRCQIESAAMDYEKDVVDQGRSALLKRREFGIIIFGSDRIAMTLAPLLVAGGFNQLRTIIRKPGTDPAHRIGSKDLAGTFLRSSDLGEPKSARLLELRRDYTLFSDEVAPNAKVNLIITTETPSADRIQRWMSEQTPHLLVRPDHGGVVEVGPLIVPGKSPCSRCIILSSPRQEELIPREIPETSSAMTAFIAGVIASDIALFAHSGHSVFLATSFRFSMLSPLKPGEKSWQIHPGCGCIWS